MLWILMQGWHVVYYNYDCVKVFKFISLYLSSFFHFHCSSYRYNWMASKQKGEKWENKFICAGAQQQMIKKLTVSGSYRNIIWQQNRQIHASK